MIIFLCSQNVIVKHVMGLVTIMIRVRYRTRFPVFLVNFHLRINYLFFCWASRAPTYRDMHCHSSNLLIMLRGSANACCVRSSPIVSSINLSSVISKLLHSSIDLSSSLTASTIITR